MQRSAWMIALALVGGCGEKKAEAPAGPKTYKLSVRADKEDPPGGVTVSITWPAGWTERELKPTGPRLAIAGADGVLEGTALLLRYCPDALEDAACVAKIIEQLHDPAKTKTTAVGDRTWIDSTLGKMMNGSLFVYHPAT